MHIESGTQLLGVRVVDANGHHLGRLAAAYCTLPLTVVWLVLRLPGLRRRWRAIPARNAAWHDPAQTTLRVAYRRPLVLASPAIDEDQLDTPTGRTQVEQFYTIPTASATC